jgi:predicted NBD/HSP70 family sugar kinase/biotin operon repressor
MNAKTFLGSNINLVKAHNLQAILLSLLHDERVSRVELAEKTSLSTTTITNLTGELLDRGIIIELPNEHQGARRKVGRPRTILQLVPSARYAVGVHIGVGLYRVAVTNLHAEIICNNIAHYDLDTPPEDVINEIATLIETTINQSKVDRKRILGVGVGASGLVDHKSGMNVVAPRLDWHNVPIREILEDELEIPVCVENNVRTMATTMIPEGGEKCKCGNRGCLETLVSETVLIRKANELAANFPDSILSNHLKHPNSRKPIECIFDAAREGDQATRDLIQDRAYYLGIALANLVNILNPEQIILGGMFAQGHDLILPVAEDTMKQQAFAKLGEKVHLQTTSFGWRAGVIGAASLALTSFFYMQAEGA